MADALNHTKLEPIFPAQCVMGGQPLTFLNLAAVVVPFAEARAMAKKTARASVLVDPEHALHDAPVGGHLFVGLRTRVSLSKWFLSFGRMRRGKGSGDCFTGPL